MKSNYIKFLTETDELKNKLIAEKEDEKDEEEVEDDEEEEDESFDTEDVEGEEVEEEEVEDDEEDESFEGAEAEKEEEEIDWVDITAPVEVEVPSSENEKEIDWVDITAPNEVEVPSSENEKEEEDVYNSNHDPEIGFYTLDKEEDDEDEDSEEEKEAPPSGNITRVVEEKEEEIQPTEVKKKEDEETVKRLFNLNKTLLNYTSVFDGTFNPYNTLVTIRDILAKEHLVLPDFDLDPTKEEWVYNVQLKDSSEENRTWIAHLEILKNPQEGYTIRIGVFSKD